MTTPGLPYAPAAAGADPPVVTTPPGRWPRRLDAGLRLAGGLISVVAAVVTGLLEIGLSSLRVGGTLIGVSVPVAVAANLALAWFAHRTVGAKWAVALPWVAWTALMFLAAGFRTTEGDHLFYGENWVALPLVLFGSVAFGGYLYRLILSSTPLR